MKTNSSPQKLILFLLGFFLLSLPVQAEKTRLAFHLNHEGEVGERPSPELLKKAILKKVAKFKGYTLVNSPSSTEQESYCNLECLTKQGIKQGAHKILIFSLAPKGKSWEVQGQMIKTASGEIIQQETTPVSANTNLARNQLRSFATLFYTDPRYEIIAEEGPTSKTGQVIGKWLAIVALPVAVVLGAVMLGIDE